MFAVTDEVRRRLEDVGGLNDRQIAVLVEASIEDELTNWSREKFEGLDGFGRQSAFVAWTVIQQYKVPDAERIRTRADLPETAPYLGPNGEGYDPRDPSQYYTHPETGEMYRWDGKRSAQYPGGMRRPVVMMPHVERNGVLIPDPEQVSDVIRVARSKGADWFHRGYASWVNPSGKPYAMVDPEKRAEVVRTIESVKDFGYISAA